MNTLQPRCPRRICPVRIQRMQPSLSVLGTFLPRTLHRPHSPFAGPRCWSPFCPPRSSCSRPALYWFGMSPQRNLCTRLPQLDLDTCLPGSLRKCSAPRSLFQLGMQRSPPLHLSQDWNTDWSGRLCMCLLVLHQQRQSMYPSHSQCTSPVRLSPHTFLPSNLHRLRSPSAPRYWSLLCPWNNGPHILSDLLRPKIFRADTHRRPQGRQQP